MSGSFDSYNAPQFFDFSKDLHVEENAEAYFEVDHENVELEGSLINKHSEAVQEKDEFKEYYHTPRKTTPAGSDNNESNKCEARKSVRRTMSVGDLNLHELEPELENEDGNDISTATSSNAESLEETPNHKTKHTLRKTSSNMNLKKDKACPTRTSAPRLARVSSRDNLNRLAQPKRYASAQNLNQGEYVSTAEYVRKFQNGTPRRFRSKPNLESNVFNKLVSTVPQSPMLKTKARHRPLNILSREEQELVEYEECQKFKIKAHPLNKKILGPVKPLTVDKKPATVPEPFKITVAPRKVMESPKKETFEFRAKPVPKTLHEPPKLKESQKVTTKPQTPPFMKRYVKEQVRPKSTENKQEENKSCSRPENTKPIPFSFEKRDKHMQKKKEEMIKKLFEDEKKAREFHARPVPKAILNSRNSSLQRSDSSNSIQPRTKSEESLSTQFKARPATVLYKKPFEPKRDERHLIEITEFQLNTEMRAREREEFEQHKKEKEERIALAKQMEEQMMLQKEEEEIARIRKEAQYKAQPIKKYKEVKIQPSGKVTEPVSPKFHAIKTRNKNKENKENSNEN